jgi:integrase
LEQEDLDWLARYLEKYGKPPGNFLFRSRSGTPLSRRNTLKRVVAPAAKKLGIEGFSWHYLRHWHGSYMAARGVPPEDLRRRMGHASIITTLQYYVHVVDGQARQAAKVASQLVPLRPEEAADDVA